MTENRAGHQSSAIKGYPIYAFFASLVVAILVMLVYRWAMMPNVPELPELDNNTACYASFVMALDTGEYAEVAAVSQEVLRITTDADLRKLVTTFRRQADLMLESNISTFEEANSLSGGIKGFMTGFTNPAASIEAISQMIDSLITDYDAIIRRVDNRYQPKIESWIKTQEQIQTAMAKAESVRSTSRIILLVVVSLLTYFGIMARTQVEEFCAELQENPEGGRPAAQPHHATAGDGLGVSSAKGDKTNHIAAGNRSRHSRLNSNRKDSRKRPINSTENKVVRCSACSQKLRVPATVKQITITCSACGNRFDYP